MQSRAQDAGKGGLVPPIIAGTGAKTNTTGDICRCVLQLLQNKICDIVTSGFMFLLKQTYVITLG